MLHPVVARAEGGRLRGGFQPDLLRHARTVRRRCGGAGDVGDRARAQKGREVTGRWAAIEAGGTKFVCAVGSGPDDLTGPVRFDTLGPEETVRAVAEWLRSNGPFDGAGVGTFGPVDVRTGSLTTTPKLTWRGFPLRQALERALGVPVAMDTDVNAAALGEHRWGAARGIENFLYMTVGTGIGGG
ncbi:MAG TPA: hypothetical protein DEH78_20825, partial [Solibacterales bacterium]|nr:hypothetical protein [Bryobacterales bacterium]